MRWKPISEAANIRLERYVLQPVAVMCLVVASPALIPAGVMLWVTYKIDKALSSPIDEWADWFAWRPVKLGHWADGHREWVWFERVQRCRRPYNWPTEYRLRTDAGRGGE